MMFIISIKKRLIIEEFEKAIASDQGRADV